MAGAKKYPAVDKGLDCSGYVLNVLQRMRLLTDLNPDLTSCDTLWEHCDPIPATQTRPGDLVFFEGTYATTGMSHIGILTKPGGVEMISARAPGVHVEPHGTAFWNTHLAGFGRIKGLPE